MDRAKLHKEICDKIHDTFNAKDNDYGGAFTKTRKKYPNTIFIHLNEKLERAETLTSGTVQQVKEESIEDTFVDMAGYCIMELMERRIDAMEAEAKAVKAVTEELLTPYEETAMSICEAISELSAKAHAEHFWENKNEQVQK